MTDSDRLFGRREFVHLTGAASVACTAGLAGCMDDGEGDGPGDGEEDGDEEELPEGVNETVFEQGPVPEEYRNAVSQADEERMPAGELVAKASVSFMEASEARQRGIAGEEESCGNCAEFIPDKNGDGFGACAKVEGYIGIEDWCSLWESIEDALEEQEDGAGSG